MKKADYTVIALGIGLAIMCALMFICASQKTDLQRQKDALVIQNVQLTKDVREAKADAFKAGLITCGNEDITFLNEESAFWESEGQPELAGYFNDLAQTWAYDEDTLQAMIDDYMNGDTH